MLTEKNTDLLISILLIERIKRCRDAYGLTQILAFKFNIIDNVRVIKELISEDLINYTETNGLGHFTLSAKGRYILGELDRDLFREKLLIEYPKDIEFIKVLLR